MDVILRTHQIDPDKLRADDFWGFFENRKAALLALIEKAIGKKAIVTEEAVEQDEDDAEDENEANEAKTEIAA